jgi:hypothetical protein
MPVTNLTDIKPQYLETIELIRGYLKAELGKTGPVSVPVTELKNIAAPWKINRYLGQLAQDKLIEPLPQIEIEIFESDEPGEVEIVCIKTIEELQEYRHSLQGISGHSISFPVSSWPVLEMRFTNSQEVVVTAHELAGDESRMLTYGDLGFADKRNGRPNVYWEFLLILAKHGGQLSPSEQELPHRNKVSKWKQGVKEQLQKVFRLDSDPFYPFETNNQYEIKFTIQYHEQSPE